MYTQQQINQFKENLKELNEDLKRDLHPLSVKMINADINRINTILQEVKR